MAKQVAIGRSEKEIGELLAGYERSGLTRRGYCEQEGVPVTTFDYYRRSRAKKTSAALVPVRVAAAASQDLLTLVCTNGRRIEVPNHFSEDGLLRLLRVAERA